MIASTKLKSTYAKYAKVPSSGNLTGAEVAKRIMAANDIYGVTVQEISGELTDHYDPAKKTVNLSKSIYQGTSIAALGVAAHECGHVIQDNTEYFPLRLRHALVPVANIGSNLGVPLILIGILFGGVIGNAELSDTLINIGLLAFGLAVLFQVVTLPVEYNASNRAREQLYSLGLITEEEKKPVKEVLSAAALTYVASALSGALQLLRLFLLTGGNSRRK
ncbi:MAG: zinc metallopeptidase [Lachnospiraceae bacterium]|nr:zinc metallopeptidase [Lachnospiraceae bacterium]